MPKATLSIQYPKTARDAVVLLLDQIMTAINRGQLVVSDKSLESALQSWCSRAAVIMSDAAVTDDYEIERLLAALENAEQFLDLYVNGASSIEDGRHTLAHVSSALRNEQSTRETK